MRSALFAASVSTSKTTLLVHDRATFIPADIQAELNISLPCEPEVFMKPAQCINNPLDPIVLPASAGTAIDAEVELAVIIGKDCKDATVDSAMDFVLGYTVANDVTARDVQTHTSQWGYCKSYDGFCPLGPALVRPQLERLQMRTELDGEVLQDQTTGQMIFSVAEIIAHLSKVRRRNIETSANNDRTRLYRKVQLY